MWVVVTAVPFGFLLGGLLGRSLVSIAASSAPHPTALPVAPARRFRLLLLIFVLVGWLEELHQFIGAGTVPLLSGNIDAARVSLPGGPTIILTDLLIVAAATSFFVAPHPFDRQVRVEFLLGVTALAGLALEGGRGTIIQSVTIAFIARWLYVGRPRTRSIVAILAIGLTLVSAAFFVRTAQHSNDALGIELRDRVLPATPVLLRPLLPLDLALATNFEALARVVDDFPNNEPYGRGLYSAHGLDLFIRNARDLTTVTAQLSPPWVTSTAAGPFWADGGLILVVAGFILIGAISTAAFAIARITRAAADALVAASFVFLAGFCVYQNLFTQQMDWVVVAPLLFLAGATAEGVSPGPRIAAIRRLVRRPARRMGRAGALLAISVAVVLGAAAAVQVEGVLARSVVATSPPCLVVDHSTTVAAPWPVGSSVMTDGDEETAPATSLWYLVDRRGTHVAKALGRLEIRPGRVLNQRIPIEMQFLRGATSFDISHWGDPSESVLVRLEQVRRGVRVSLIALDGSSRVRFQGFAPLPRAPTGIRRVLAFATWSGDRPDLFAIDRNVSTGAVSVAVFGGESAFRQLIFSRQQLPISLAGPDPTTLDVFRVSGVPALIFVLPAALTHSRLPEVHVLDGRYDLERFLVESDLSSKLAGADPVVLGSSGDGATIYALHPTARAAWRVDAVPLTAAPPQVSDECSASSTSSP